MFHNRVKDFYISRVVFQTMPQFSAVPIRGFTLSGNTEAVQQLRNLPGIAMGSLSPQSISSRIPSLVQMDMAGAPLPINGGWATPHCSALIEVKLSYVDGTATMYRMRCYTDRSDFSPMTGLPAGDLGIFVNTIEEVRVIDNYTPVGMSGVNQVYYDSTQSSVHSQSPVFTVRPEDVLADMAYKYETAVDRRNARNVDDVMNSSVLSMLTSVPHAAAMGVTTAPNWLASILNTYIDNVHAKETGGLPTGDPVMTAVDALSGNTYYENPFITLVAQKMLHNNGTTGWMNWSHLTNLDPALAGDTQRVIHARNVNISTETAELSSYSAEASIAQAVAVSIRPWMYSSMLSSVSFTATNMTLTGETDVQYTDKVIPLVNLDEGNRQGLMMMFTKNIATMLMPQITNAGRMPLHLVVHASHSSNITVVVTLGGGGNVQVEPKRYSFPAFMDNVYSPMLSHRSPYEVGESAHLLMTTVDMMRNKPLTTTQALPHTQFARPQQPTYGHPPMYGQQPVYPQAPQPTHGPVRSDGANFDI